MRPGSIIFIALLAGTIGSCRAATGPDGGTQPSGGNNSTPTITVANNRFTPDTVTIAAGQAVTWKWNACASDGYGGSACTDHKVLFSDGSASPAQSSGSFSKSFPTAGTYAYHCAIHGTIMTGTIVVK